MKNLLLSSVLIALPVGLFAAGYSFWPSAAPAAQTSANAPSLGHMTLFQSITSDVQKIAKSGDLTAAQTRITDLETAWDVAQSTLRPINPNAWGTVDDAIDAALKDLRAKTPDAAQVDTTLTTLQTALANPSGGTDATGTVTMLSGVAVTDANGRALPCESMLTQFKEKLAASKVSDADRATLDTLQAKGTERCNADDDARADDFFAQGLALMSH